MSSMRSLLTSFPMPAARCPAPNDGGSIVSSCPGQLSAICDSLADPDLSSFCVLSTGENEAQ
jgi:hypothetical protein